LVALIATWCLVYVRAEHRAAGPDDNPLLAEPDGAELPGETMQPEASAPLRPEDFAPQ
jgi:hypothetical protein